MANDLAAIKKQIAALEKKAEALIKAEAGQAIAKVKELIERYGLTAEDLGFGGKRGKKKAASVRAVTQKKSSGKKTVGVPMYRDPESGKTWTGRGKPPTWIAGAKDRAKFLIDAASSPSGTAGNAETSASSKKAVTKPTRVSKKIASKAKGKRAARKATKAVTVTSAAKRALKGKKTTKTSTAAKTKAAKSSAAKRSKALGAGAAAPSGVQETASEV